MRDGVVLRADVWLPKAEGRFPTLVYRTPYGKQSAPTEWTTFEKVVVRGYAVVIQDVRGRFASEGDFSPYQNEGKDGYHGAGHDVFDADKLLLFRRIV